MSKDLFKITQLSYVYKDVKKQAEVFESSFELPKFTFQEYSDLEIIYREKKTRIAVRCGKSRLFNSYGIELIQLIKGAENLYKEFLDSGREGFHHIDFLVYDIEKYINYFDQKGVKVIQEGKSLRKWAYLDTERVLGFMIELIEVAPPRRNRK